MIILDIKQNTPEWKEARRTKIGASDCPIIMRASPYKTPRQLWEEKVQGKSSFQTHAMLRGHEMEDDARKWAEKTHSCLYDPIVAQHINYDWMIASLDGYDPERKQFIEIKCPNAEIFKSVSMGEVPEHYQWQMQHQMAVTNCEKGFLVVWNGKDGIMHTVYRNDQMIEDLVQAELKFYERWMNFEPPEESDAESVRTDEEFISAEQALREIISQREEIEELEKIHRDSLIYLAANKSCRGKYFIVEKCPGKKVVDYKKIPQLQGIDLRPFERKGSDYWRIKEAR